MTFLDSHFGLRLKILAAVLTEVLQPTHNRFAVVNVLPVFYNFVAICSGCRVSWIGSEDFFIFFQVGGKNSK